MTYADIKEAAGDTIAGLSFTLYWALWDWVDTFPSVDPAPTAVEDEITYIDDIVFKSTFQFYALEINQNNSLLAMSPVGENGNNNWQARITIYKSGIPNDFLAWVNHVKNKPLVLLAQDQCGQMRMVGNQCAPARMIPEGEFTTNTPGNAKSSTIQFGNDGPLPYLYPGLIPLTPAI